MPIIIPKEIPAYNVLKKENVFVMTDKRAVSQDIRPIEIAIINLMPNKIDTEAQLMRLLSNSPLQVKVTLISTESYLGKNTAQSHLEKFYTFYKDIKDKAFDGLIITGAPVETMAFDEVQYWNELKEIMDYADRYVTSTLFICWGAQAGLYHHYGIEKNMLDKKMFGVFDHVKTSAFEPLLKGVDEVFHIPHSRHTAIDENEVYSNDALEVLAYSKQAGAAIIKSKDNKKFFLTGHSEYDRDSLKNEYVRDIGKGMQIDMPEHYFIDGDIDKIEMNWASTANLIFTNWLNYYVYQVTPFKPKSKE